MSEWISVEERLPEENKDVWVAKKGGVMLYTCHYHYKSGNWYGYGQAYIEEGITHWMELPEAPM